MAEPIRNSPAAPRRVPVHVHLQVPAIIRGIAHTSLDSNQPRPKISMEEEARGILVTAYAKTPGEPARKFLIPYSNVACVAFGEE
jgi:hypothetical protein